MAHPDYEAFATTPLADAADTPEQFQDALDTYYDAIDKQIVRLSVELGIEINQATKLWCVRTKTYWSQELEDRLLRAFRAGHNIMCLADDVEEKLQALGY